MDAIAFALGRRLSLIRGPPGTGKTITAALLVASALRLRGWQPSAAEGEAESGGGGEAEGSSGAAEAGAEEGAEADAEVLFARLQAISPGVQRRDYECSDEAGRPRWDRAGLESDLKLAGRAAAGAAAGASVGTAAGAHATGDVIGGRGSAQSEREGEGENEGEGEGEGPLPPPRVLAVAHSNGAADVLLRALLRLGVPAVRGGRPAAVSPSVRRRTAVALAEQHPEVTPPLAAHIPAAPPHGPHRIPRCIWPSSTPR